MKKISILGLGYLGKRLAAKLIGNYQVFTSTKSSNSNMEGIHHSHIDLNSEIKDSDFWHTDTLIICIPPVPNLSNMITNITKAYQGKKIILVSSTSVYRSNQGNVNEQTTPLGKEVLIESERIISESSHDHCILRLAGLVGSNRTPWEYLEGKHYDNDMYLHLVHIDDCVQAIANIIKVNPQSRIFNIVNNQRQLKSEFYKTKCTIAPSYGPLLKDARKISNQRSLDELSMEYINL